MTQPQKHSEPTHPEPSHAAPPLPASRALPWAFIIALLAICAGFPLVQALYEALVMKEVPHVLKVATKWPTKENLHRWDEQAKDRSLFAKWLRPKTLQLRYDLLGEVAPKAVPGIDGWLFYNQDVDYLLQPPYADPRFYRGSFDTVVAGHRVNLRNPLVAMRDFRDQLKARGIDLLVVPIPGKPSIYPEKLRRDFAGQALSPTLKLIETLNREGFKTVDLYTPFMQAKAKGGDPLYLRRDTHWTPQGLAVAAEAIVARLREMGWASTDSSRYAAKSVDVERWGDIAEMTKVPDRRAIWPTEKVQALQIVDSAGALYRDDPNADILWLGDSYSRIYQTDTPRSAGIIAQVAHALQRPLASVVNDGGASTVVRQQLSRRAALLRNKKLVIWTFVERDLRFGSKGWQIESLPD